MQKSQHRNLEGELVTVDQMAEITNLGTNTIRRLAQEAGAVRKIGKNYRYRKSDECFERPVKKAYRISVHESYREGGKVRKKQTVICTIRYYDIMDFGYWIGDYVRGGLDSKGQKVAATTTNSDGCL